MGRDETHPEIEVKFDLGSAGGTPDWGVLAAVKGVAEVRRGGVQRLTATYYDSAGLDLLTHGITLRRRTGGSDPGWHLKLPAGQARQEIHRPAGRSGSPVPAELAALVRAFLRDAAVQPVVTLRTVRTLTLLVDARGGVLAEVADDVVTATVPGQESSTSWREIEVELVDGSPRLLASVAERLRGQGAVPAAHPSKPARALAGDLPVTPVPNGHRAARRTARAGEVVLAHLRGQRDQLLALDPQVRLDSPDAVHQLRVTTRRLRSALATFGPLYAADATSALRGELAWLAGVLGTARDAEVLRDLLAGELSALPEPLVHGPVAERITTGLDQAYRQAHATVVTELDGPRHLALLNALDDFVTAPPFAPPAHRPAKRELPVRVARAVRRVTRALTAARAQGELQQRELLSHEVRKAAKRARYAAEALQPFVGTDARALAKAMRKVQETLGSHQDSLLARDWLLTAAQHAHQAGEPTFTYGLLYERQCRGDGGTDANLAAAATLLAPLTRLWPAQSARR
ncbi:MAG TPA: CYTH and CHAD domain-containing protein [Kineosporiaceae bacterium]|nr:CYTH and CHAD domain-containing protein [Kineosporiaceae bacterium]